MSETNMPPKIERGIPDQDGNPGFYLSLPMVEHERFQQALQAIVPEEGDLAWSAKPPAWWIAAKHIDRVRSLALAFFGVVQEFDELGPTFYFAKDRPA